MSKKLLNESTVRRFMGLANLAPLSESFLETQVNEEEEINEETETVEDSAEATNEGEEAIEEAAEATNESTEEVNEAEEPVEEAVEATNEELDMEDAAEEPAMDDMEADAGEDMANKARALLDALADALSAAGIDVNVTDTEEAPEAEMDAEIGDMEATDPMMGDEEAEEDEEVEMAEGTSNLDDLVAEITKRVMDRLNQ